MKFHTFHFWRTLVLVLGLFLGASTSVWAHKASDAYLEFNDSTVKFSIALRDLDAAIDTLDTNNDRSLIWGEIRQNLPVIQSWVGDGMRIDCNRKVMDLTWAFDSLEERPDGVYVRLSASISCPSSGAIGVDYQLMKAVDSTHRLLVGGVLQGRSEERRVGKECA